MKYLFIVILFLSGCSFDKEEELSTTGMKCGAGKCGANMFDGNSILEKKKRNILSQMRSDDSRKSCVLAAKGVKQLYNCVRKPNSKTLTIKCGDERKESTPVMRCGAGRCGAGKCGG